jgi:hypothetical protein
MPSRSVAVTFVVVVVVALVAAALATARDEQAPTTSKTIASTTTSDFRVVVSAANLGGGAGAPAAAVTVRTFERSGGDWRRTSAQRLAGPYFWKTLTGPHAVCRLEIRTTAAKAGFRPHATVQLLRSPSLGCGPVSAHRLTD